MKKYILAIDQGTTGTTAALVDSEKFNFVDKINREFPQIFPKPSWVEHNLNAIWTTVEETVTELLSKNSIDDKNISCIGITNQRETTCAFSKDGTALANAIVWQDRRTSEYCANADEKIKQKINQKTGLPLDPYFSASKMNWLLSNNDQVKQANQKNDLLFGTIDSFLLYKLSGQRSHKTEPSNASRTLLMDLESGNWDQELLDHFNIPESTLPEICDSFGKFGETKSLSFLPDDIPISGILGDQQSALFGQAGINEGDMKCTYGTGAFMLLNTGEKIQRSQTGLLSTAAYRYKNKISYALEGSSFIAGAAVQWLRDNLDLIPSSPEIEPLAAQATNEQMEHLLFFPFFSGIGSPHWKPDAKGAIIGLTRDTAKPQIARACLEGITFAINDLISAMKKDYSSPIEQLKVDGGACANNLMMQMQADISDLEIVRPMIIETTAYGAALAAAIGCDLLSLNDLDKFWSAERSFTESSNRSFYKAKNKQWKQTIQRLFL